MHETGSADRQAKQESVKRQIDNMTQSQSGQVGYGTGLGGALGGYGIDTAEYRPTLRDRLKRQIESAVREQRRARSANELFELLEKNPDVARILELMEETS